jgi:hypothetical protein
VQCARPAKFELFATPLRPAALVEAIAGMAMSKSQEKILTKRCLKIDGCDGAPSLVEGVADETLCMFRKFKLTDPIAFRVAASHAGPGGTVATRS